MRQDDLGANRKPTHAKQGRHRTHSPLSQAKGHVGPDHRHQQRDVLPRAHGHHDEGEKRSVPAFVQGVEGTENKGRCQGHGVKIGQVSPFDGRGEQIGQGEDQASQAALEMVTSQQKGWKCAQPDD